MLTFLLGVVLFFAAIALAITLWPVTLVLIWGGLCYIAGLIVYVLVLAIQGADHVTNALGLGVIAGGWLFLWGFKKVIKL